ncbi:MAG: C4-dicarboxylate ABC transporter substrate-binding protein, partial [Syntrophales bacterium LBB04]|nr:C4-dicarboxylate ABC transporter substrate-binding protein [Syntrophales bacterium LBB04]
TSNLAALAGIFYSPLWVFYRGSEIMDVLSQHTGKRISIGPEGSGVLKVSLDLLKAADASDPPTQLYGYSMTESSKGIKEGRLDAVMTFGSTDSGLVQELLNVPGIRLMNFSLAEAYTRFFPDLSHVILPKGVVSPLKRFPPEDIHLLAPTTNLIARSNLHPALVYLLLEAAVEIHGGAGWFHRAGEFPSLKAQDFPISDQAQRYYRSGPSVLYDYLPFWVAAFLERLILLLIPLGVVMIPLIGIMPWVYTWRNRSRYYHWYRELRVLNNEIREGLEPGRFQGCLERLDRIETAVSRIHVAVGFYDEIFVLQEHIKAARQRLLEKNPPSPQPPDVCG